MLRKDFNTDATTEECHYAVCCHIATVTNTAPIICVMPFSLYETIREQLNGFPQYLTFGVLLKFLKTL